MPAPESPQEILDVNRRYHDATAEEYDGKWGISFGEPGRRQVRGKVEKLLGPSPGPFTQALEIGAGTGYFMLNLMQEGIVRAGTCTDISPGMLEALEANAERLGLSVETVAADATDLPFPDGSFDLVLGHAVLHHLPYLDRAFAEFHRVLRPGGVLLFAGEPSRHGDRIAAYPKRAGVRVAPLWRRAMRARPASHENGWHGPNGSHVPGASNGSARTNGGAPDDHALEHVVDVHAFVPDDLERHARVAGFEDVRVRGEELLANWFGWFNRTVESTAEPADIPMPWIQYAYRGYLLLQAVDRRLLEPRLPAGLFYNLMLAARRPA
jgi:ubiquinone/menaquinone biosynthesis C-methylase UbiE